MAEEMRGDDRVFLMGEEVAEYQGRLQGQPGPSRGVRRQARHRHADHRTRLCRHRRRRRHGRAAADRRVHDLELRDAGDRPHHQLGGQDPLHGRRGTWLPHSVQRTEWGGRARRRAAQPGIFDLVRPLPRPQGHRSLQCCRRQRACSRPRSAIPIRWSFWRTRSSTVRASRCRKLDDFVLPIGKAKVAACGRSRHHRRLLPDGGARPPGSREACRGRHRGRGHRPPHHPTARHRDHRQVRQEDQPPGDASRRAGRASASARRCPPS